MGTHRKNNEKIQLKIEETKNKQNKNIKIGNSKTILTISMGVHRNDNKKQN